MRLVRTPGNDTSTRRLVNPHQRPRPQSAIESSSLRLEPPLVAAHAEEMFAPLSAAAIYDYMPEQPPLSAAALRERYVRLEEGHSADGRQQWLNWIVTVCSHCRASASRDTR